LKILFDDQVLSEQVYGGISRYFVNLCNYLNASENCSVKLSLFYSENYYLKKLGFPPYFSFLSNKVFKGRDRLLDILIRANRFKSIYHLKNQNFDIFHPTYYDPYFLNYLMSKPFVLTIFDMIHENYCSKYYFKDDPVIVKKKELFDRAAKILTISNNTKNDIMQFYGVDGNTIDITYLGNSLIKESAKRFTIPSKFILFVGGRAKYKNFNFFIRAVSGLLLNNRNLNIISAGSFSFNSEELALFEELDISNQIFHFNVSDEELAFLYTKALVFVFPSEYEGFGLPIVEAFSCGCPVVLSRASCFPEIAQDASLYFDLSSSGSLVDAIEKVINDAKLRNDIRKKGFKRSKDFSWQKTRDATLLAYKSVL
jgi:glycosyltransferase involved in cell wall biosynthesis